MDKKQISELVKFVERTDVKASEFIDLASKERNPWYAIEALMLKDNSMIATDKINFDSVHRAIRRANKHIRTHGKGIALLGIGLVAMYGLISIEENEIQQLKERVCRLEDENNEI